MLCVYLIIFDLLATKSYFITSLFVNLSSKKLTTSEIKGKNSIKVVIPTCFEIFLLEGKNVEIDSLIHAERRDLVHL